VVTKVWESEEYDLAVLKIDAKPRAELGVDRSLNYQVGDRITVYGFLDYHSNQSPVVIPGLIIGAREFAKMDQILTSSLIVEGNSGGPVLDSKNRLIGIASRGPSDNAEAADKQMSAVTSIRHLPLHL
jgi:RNA-directed DNA polymerase